MTGVRGTVSRLGRGTAEQLFLPTNFPEEPGIQVSELDQLKPKRA